MKCAGGAIEVTDLFSKASRSFQLPTGTREIPGSCGRPGLRLQTLGLIQQDRWEAEAVQRGKRLGCPAGLTGQRQRLCCGDVAPSRVERAPELAENGAVLAGAPKRSAHAPLL